MADDGSARIFGLIAVAEDQQAAVRAGLEGLAQERAGLAKDRVLLVQAAETMQKLTEELFKKVLQTLPQIQESSSKAATATVKAALAGVGADTMKAVADAAQPMLDRIADSVTSAGTAQQQLQRASSEFGRRWMTMIAIGVAALLSAVAIVSYAAVYLQRQELEELQVKRTKLTAELADVQGQVDQAKRNNGRKPAK